MLVIMVLFSNIFCVAIVRMQRKKGQFTSSKASSDEVGSTSSSWSATGQDENMLETSWVSIHFSNLQVFFHPLVMMTIFPSSIYCFVSQRWYTTCFCCYLKFWAGITPSLKMLIESLCYKVTFFSLFSTEMVDILYSYDFLWCFVQLYTLRNQFQVHSNDASWTSWSKNSL